MGIHAVGSSGSWSELPADVLVTVLEGLAIRDLCRAGAVCRGWGTASSYVRGQHRALSRPRTPCLLYTAAGSSSSSDPLAATLYSIADGRSYPVPLNGASIPGGELWLGASHGWLVTVDDHAELHLVNPVTGQRIDSLPSVATIEQVRRVHDDTGAVVADTYLVYPYDWSLEVLPQELDHPITLDARKLTKYLYLRALISLDPSDGDGCVVVLIHRPSNQLSFARPGDGHWTWIRPPQENTEYCDCAFDDDGRTLYALRYDGAIHAFDLHRRPALEKEVILRPQVYPVTRRITKYLLHAPWLSCWLQVWRNMELISSTGLDEATEWMRVYQVDLAAQKLVEIENIGDHALFLGCNYSFALAATNCPGILSDHIYYTDSEEYYALYKPHCSRDIGMYNVGEGTFHKVQPPCPWSNWPLPTWIAPSLAYKTR